MSQASGTEAVLVGMDISMQVATLSNTIDVLDRVIAMIKDGRNSLFSVFSELGCAQLIGIEIESCKRLAKKITFLHPESEELQTPEGLNNFLSTVGKLRSQLSDVLTEYQESLSKAE